MRKLILDTGPLIALLDQSESSHEKCVSFLKIFNGMLITTEPVVTEAMYLLNQSIHFQKACVDFIMKADVQIVPIVQKTLLKVIALMEKYSDLPMDYADATLVSLAGETSISEIFTLDKRGFETYRWRKNKFFTLYP